MNGTWRSKKTQHFTVDKMNGHFHIGYTVELLHVLYLLNHMHKKRKIGKFNQLKTIYTYWVKLKDMLSKLLQTTDENASQYLFQIFNSNWPCTQAISTYLLTMLN